jgi:uncharacterized protein YegL
MTDHTTMEIHADDNFIFALDVSGSMGATDCPGGLTRFEYSLEKMKQFCHQAASFEDKGICIFKFGEKVTKFDHIDESKIDSIIGASAPTEGATMTHLVIDAAYEEHVEDGHEDTFLFIITDGEPTKPQAVINSITRIANTVKSENEFKIVFLTVGEISETLRIFLNTIDHSIKAQFDIVDVLPLNEVTFMAAVNQANSK